ncbi:MAG: glutathione S-transferase N-terminal domain-containing protein [Deltaproteobacteria bacterium]|nr:glutathione S-transferase N-terminal domain-containing protein [Deltaproteobacteria bacterium]
MSVTLPTRWPAQHPDRIQLYSLATPNGQKAGVVLEELGLPYEAHKIDIMAGDQFDPEYVAINPNSKIPAIIDPNGPGGQPIALMESASILLYLSEKAGGALNPAEHRWETLQWLFFQMASVGPFFGQFGHFFKFAKDKTTDSYGVERYTKEAKRLLGVLDARLADRTYLVGEQFTLADIATFPWVKALDFYEGKPALDYDSFTNVEPWVQRCLDREAVQRGLAVCSFG